MFPFYTPENTRKPKATAIQTGNSDIGYGFSKVMEWAVQRCSQIKVGEKIFGKFLGDYPCSTYAKFSDEITFLIKWLAIKREWGEK